MKSYQLIYQVIQLIEKMETENEDKDMSLIDFAGFLNNYVMSPTAEHEKSNAPFGDNEATTLQIANQLDNNIGRLISFLSRYAKYYIKKAIEGTPLLAVEDFSCLGILMTHEHLSQSELITLNVQEKTSGVQVIKRLIEANLAEQWDDPNDKRGKRIAITKLGKQTLHIVFRDMKNVGKIVTGTLTEPEKITLLFLLQKLEHFHKNFYEQKAVLNKTDLQTKAGYLGNNNSL